MDFLVLSLGLLASPQLSPRLRYVLKLLLWKILSEALFLSRAFALHTSVHEALSSTVNDKTANISTSTSY
jgi:hypothetical protein